MKDFYTVTKSVKDNDTTQTSLKVNAEHELYKGHFPGRPVTPGVVLMQLFKEEAERISDEKLSLKRASNVKFTAVFDPTDNDELILESKLEKQGAYYELKGIAKSETGIITKINALYEVL
ncbi:3-hydroxyacyl-[acyl-carrier-protein] dehydratase [Gramella sp. Hel_I_59]|uniref:hydroxymyristoyl-ACP dehydratase n=1 Tax=Gramella sp. Hel_I_59 TaxID=1249978 RepID=UPI0011530DA7|nr:hydroxymyristoyl-ACP dehydratase [Gramella sp. Hel_I_59]TQI70743.1 3-hydroxyacyl-[acyl-carrier-protein] dehydratase [Gramella sp. Hel_I_59]